MRWEFVQQPGAAASWRWQCIDQTTGSIVKVSRATFTTLVECLEDAKSNGYSGPAAPGASTLNSFSFTPQPPPIKDEKR